MGILRTDKISGLEKPTAVTGSVVFDGTGDYLDLTIPAFDNSNFTFELWFYGTTYNAWNTIFEYGDHTSSSNGIFVSLKGSGVFARNGTTDISNATINTPYLIPEDDWNHLALTREGTTARLHINGNFIGSATWSKVFTETNLRIASARYLSGESYTGYISNFRVLKGTALYNESNFTPPVHALEVIKDTIILCCNNPDSAGADGTGKAITVNGNAAASSVSPSLTRDFTGGTEFKGVTTFDTQGYFVPPSGTTEQRGSGRGIAGGVGNALHYIHIHTQGDSKDFGDLAYTPAGYTTSYGSNTRGLIAGGYNPTVNTINYITIASTGDAKDFGDISLTNGVYGMGPAGSNTRGLFGGGWQAPGSPAALANQAQINYVTMQTLGNSADFGDLIEGVRYPAGFSSPTRAIWAGGRTEESAPTTNKNVIQYVTIASLGSATNFGDLTYAGSGGVYSCKAVCSSTRGCIAGGVISPAYVNSIDYVTITSTGNSQEFGDIPGARSHLAAMSSKDRGVFAGGYAPAATNVMITLTISTTGDAKDFGDLYSALEAPSGMSDSHGGIS